jgi:hypothetical protein
MEQFQDNSRKLEVSTLAALGLAISAEVRDGLISVGTTSFTADDELEEKEDSRQP